MKQIRILPLLLLLAFTARAQQTPLSPTTKLPAHPRLLWPKGEEATLKKTLAADPALAKLHAAILAESDRLLTVPPLERKQIGRRLLSVSREALRREMFLGYAYRMTGQAAYRSRAELELRTVAGFSDWNPTHFLDVAEMTMAVALGYDWLYSDLSPAVRAELREAMVKKGLQPSLDDRYNSWLAATHNWNQVCNAGMAFGALAIHEDQPELASSLVNRAVTTVVKAMGDYAPDGAYPEGYGYWGYGTSFNVLLISALEKALGSDFGLSQQPGFLKTAGFMVHMAGPSGDAFNYSDSGVGGGLQPAMFWFAQRLKQPSLLYTERQRLLSEDPQRYVGNRILPTALLWAGDMRLAEAKPPALTWTGGGKNPVAMMRTSWTDPAAIFVGLKAGSPSVNHAHLDVGSFVMEADGVRWAMDFGMQEYNSLESKGVKLWGKEQDSERWRVFRYRNQVHNTLTVNDSLQRVDGYAAITGFSKKPEFMSATTDLTQMYGNALAKANRGVAIVDGNHVVVRDELQGGDREATVTWTLLTPATVRIVNGNTAELTKDGKKLLLQVAEPASVTLKTGSTQGPNEYDAPNPGTTLLTFNVPVPARATAALTVRLLPEKAAGKTPKAVPALANWPR